MKQTTQLMEVPAILQAKARNQVETLKRIVQENKKSIGKASSKMMKNPSSTKPLTMTNSTENSTFQTKTPTTTMKKMESQTEIDLTTNKSEWNEAKTYDQWKAEGRFVRKGERSKTRCPVTNKALFFPYQTECKLEQLNEDWELYQGLDVPNH